MESKRFFSWLNSISYTARWAPLVDRYEWLTQPKQANLTKLLGISY